MKIHGLRLHNFLRYGETKNVIEFDKGAADFLGLSNNLALWERQQIYSKAKTQLKVWEDDKACKIISIVGQTEGNPQESNGVGKSSLFEAISYAFYEKLIRESVNKKPEDRDKGRSTLSIVREDATKKVTEAFVEILFSINDKLYLLKRGRKLSANDKHTAILQLDCLSSPDFTEQGSHSGHRADGDNETISRLIKMDYETFCNSVMFGQSDAGQFIIGSDKIRKDIIVNILQLSVISDYLQETRRRKLDCETQLIGFDSQIEVLEDKVKKFDIVNGKQQIEYAKTKIKELGEKTSVTEKKRDELKQSAILNSHQSLLDEQANKEQLINQKKQATDALLNNLLQQARSVDARLVSLKSENNNCKTRLDGLRVKVKGTQDKIAQFNRTAIDKELNLIAQAKTAKPTRQEQKKLLEEQERRVSDQISGNRAIINNLNQRIKQFETLEAKGLLGESITCPNCENHVGVSHVREKITASKNERDDLIRKNSEFITQQDALRAQISDIQDKLNNIDAYITKEPGLVRQLSDHEKLEQSIGEDQVRAQECLNQQIVIEDKIVLENSEKDRLIEEQNRIQSENKIAIAPLLDGLETLDKKIAALTTEVTNVRNQINILNIELSKYANEVKEKTLEIGRLESLILSAEETAQQIVKLKQQRLGVQKVMSRLKILEKIFGPDGAQVLIVQKYLPLLNAYLRDYLQIISGGRMHAAVITDGKKEGKVDLVVTGESASHSFMLSGGEGVKLRLAMDIALGLLSFARSKDVPEFICLDEVLAPVDTATKTLVFEMLNKLQTQFRKIMIISHDPSLQQHIKNTIVVDKIAGVSQISKQYFEN